jgi:hypothetical protein
MDTNEMFNKERIQLVDYINKQLVGPFGGDTECLYSDKPTSRYLMGTLYPQNADTDAGQGDQEKSNTAPDADEMNDSPLSMVYQLMPASAGISFYVHDCDAVEVDLWAGRYKKITKKDISQLEKQQLEKPAFSKDTMGRWPKWMRHSLASEGSPEKIVFKLNYAHSQKVSALDDFADLHVIWRPMGSGSLVTITLINKAFQEEEGKLDPEKCLFQIGFRCRTINGTIQEYPSVNRLSYDDEEEELALQYKHNITYAVGHGCAATWELDNNHPLYVGTVSLPRTEVKPVTTELESITGNAINILSLQHLANESVSVDDIRSGLNDFVTGYESWYKEIIDTEVDGRFHAAKLRITGRINNAILRMRNGIEMLCDDAQIRKAFMMANHAMLRQMIHSGAEYSGSGKERDVTPYFRPDYYAEEYMKYAWRPFQLAFQLLVIESLANNESFDRDIVDLLWFPTGGGKTEAYLALAAFELIYRRLRYGEEGAGTAVIKRYTLRLLTTQQFQRAAILICALELIRRENEELLGHSPYTLGLWVGESSSPNRYTSDSDFSKGAFELYKNLLEEDTPENPFQLQQCPWCGTEIIPKNRTNDENDYGVKATQTTFEFYCPSSDCELHDAIPVTVVDEDIYDHPPSFVIGTVDKFARLAWDDRASGMFGHASGKHLPPSLIIQDELHLISGPLGTVAGVYEAAISTLIEAKGFKPKIIAATATIRRAADQVKRLYGSDVRIFPPPGISADDSYFARIDNEAPGRLYLGVMGQGQTPITSLVQTSAVLSQSILENKLSSAANDTWWTQVIYHNSRRELGKTMTLARDDIPERIKVIASDESNYRKLTEISELSANVRGIEIPEVLSRLKVDCKKNHAIDILPCTNMISVGVDVSRLGLMLIVGQPKTTSEYIQASSRVGRDQKRPPGIVLTLYSSSKPRDRSHYENFESYHGALYRSVEPTSVTPFAPPSRDRALHASLIILVRHACKLGANEDAGLFDPSNKLFKKYVNILMERMVKAEPEEENNIRNHVERIIEEWKEMILAAKTEHKPLRFFNRGGRQYSTLLRYFGERSGDGWQTLNSMRNVDMESVISVTGEK